MQIHACGFACEGRGLLVERHTGVFVTSGPDSDEFTFCDKYDSTAYWCVEALRGFGPDGNPVRPDCCSAGRDCCRH